jgi:hypothetical protein
LAKAQSSSTSPGAADAEQKKFGMTPKRPQTSRSKAALAPIVMATFDPARSHIWSAPFAFNLETSARVSRSIGVVCVGIAPSERTAAFSSPRPRFARSRVLPAFNRLLQIEFGSVSDLGLTDRGSKNAAQNRGVASRSARALCRHSPHASNAANAACGSCFSLKTACLVNPSALAMANRLGRLCCREQA